MNVKITEDSRKCITIDKLGAARQLIAEMKEYDSTAAEEALHAAGIVACTVGDWAEETITASAEVALNCRIFDAHFDGSGDLDVWITGLVRTRKGYMQIGAYLTDIWKSTGDNAEKLATDMYFRRFEEVV